MGPIGNRGSMATQMACSEKQGEVQIPLLSASGRIP